MDGSLVAHKPARTLSPHRTGRSWGLDSQRVGLGLVGEAWLAEAVTEIAENQVLDLKRGISRRRRSRRSVMPVPDGTRCQHLRTLTLTSEYDDLLTRLRELGGQAITTCSELSKAPEVPTKVIDDSLRQRLPVLKASQVHYMFVQAHPTGGIATLLNTACLAEATGWPTGPGTSGRGCVRVGVCVEGPGRPVQLHVISRNHESVYDGTT